jgi:hypothetical protein
MKNALQETTGSKNNHEENGVLLVSNQESENMIHDMNSIYDVLMKNKDITQKSLQEIINSIQDNFGNSQCDLYGEMVDMKFIKKYGEEIEENKDLWKEILDGNCNNHSKLTFLIPSVAFFLSQSQGRALYLKSLHSIDQKSAEALSQFQGNVLWLNSLQFIDQESVKALAQFQGRELWLDGIQSIDQKMALAFSKFKGQDLSLSGLKFIDKNTALALIQSQGTFYVSDKIQKQIDFYVEENNKNK